MLSAKLDYHHDWKIILRDIESEYRMLSLDYLRKTYHGMSEGDIYRRSVDEVNIGAFPMLPGDEAHRMLRDFIHNLMQKMPHRLSDRLFRRKVLLWK